MSPIDRLRLRLGGFDALIILAVLGTLCGLLAGFAIVLFRIFTESSVVLWHTDPQATNDFETMAWPYRLALASLGGLLVGWLLQQLKPETRQVGVAHVLERLNFHQGYMSFKNAMVQFVLGGLTIATGQSVGREGPGIHLGSAAGSLLGQKLRLPNNSIRVLLACGTAAAISASFNTPLAGVVFAMEVIVMEYTTMSFVPVILASVSATVLSRGVFGHESVFDVIDLRINTLWEMPYFVLMGFVSGCVASGFIVITRKITERTQTWPIWTKTTLAGISVGLMAIAVPQVMGIGYDTVNSAIHGELVLSVLLLCVAGKFLATCICSGLGLPGGVIGPSLFIGATLGGVMGLIGALLFPDYASYDGFYAMIGMATMMGAVLQAPLAALIALLELTNNPNIIFPGMLSVIVANLVVSQLFKQPTIFRSQMRVRGIDFSFSPMTQLLRRVGVAGVMERSVVPVDRVIDRSQADMLLEDKPRWLLIREEEEFVALMEASDLARHIFDTDEARKAEQAEKQKKAAETTAEDSADGGESGIRDTAEAAVESIVESIDDAVDATVNATIEEPSKEPSVEQIDLIKIPANRQDIASVNLQATLAEAYDNMTKKHTSAAYVYRTTHSGSRRIYGIITQDLINNHYVHSK